MQYTLLNNKHCNTPTEKEMLGLQASPTTIRIRQIERRCAVPDRTRRRATAAKLHVTRKRGAASLFEGSEYHLAQWQPDLSSVYARKFQRRQKSFPVKREKMQVATALLKKKSPADAEVYSWLVWRNDIQARKMVNGGWGGRPKGPSQFIKECAHNNRQKAK